VTTPEERRIRSRIAAYAKHAQHDPRESTAPAVAAMFAKYEALADPQGTLDPTERRRRARHLIHADLARAQLAKLKRERESREAAADAALAQQLATTVPGGRADAD
jgi:hypothetical protein